MSKRSILWLSGLLIVALAAGFVIYGFRGKSTSTSSSASDTVKTMPKASSSNPTSPESTAQTSIFSKVFDSALVMCIGDPKAYYKEMFINIDEKSGIWPIEEYPDNSEEITGEIYVPLRFTLDCLQIQYKIDDTTLQINDKTINLGNKTKKDDDTYHYVEKDNIVNVIEHKNGLYLKLDKMMEMINKKVLQVGEVFAISDREIGYNDQTIGLLRNLYHKKDHPVIVGEERVNGYGYNGKGVKYKMFSNGNPVSDMIGGKPYEITVQGGGPYIRTEENGSKVSTVGTGIGFCDFNPYPRKVEELSNNSEVYRKIIKDILVKKSFGEMPVVIKQIFRADMDDDQKDEVIINAENEYKQGQKRYSMLLYRKIEGNEVKNVALEWDFIIDPKIYDGYTEREITDIIDVDNDNCFEVVSFTKVFEGHSLKVFKLNDLSKYEALN